MFTRALRAALCAAPFLLSACAAIAPVQPQPADPAVVAKINYVCAYSGLFKFADQVASSVVPVPGLSLGVNLLNGEVDKICAHPEQVAATEATVVDLINRFKAAGKM
jgi:hypothetical protein